MVRQKSGNPKYERIESVDDFIKKCVMAREGRSVNVAFFIENGKQLIELLWNAASYAGGSKVIKIATYSASLGLIERLFRMGFSSVMLLIRGQNNYLEKYVDIPIPEGKTLDIKVIESQHHKIIITDLFAAYGSANFTVTALENLGKTDSLIAFNYRAPMYTRTAQTWSGLWNHAKTLSHYLEKNREKMQNSDALYDILLSI